MMFLSKLTINIGHDPLRYRPARQWLHNLYRVHQRLWMAFPDAASDHADPSPLNDASAYPFFPERLPHPSQPTGQFLFRVESTTPPVILVQSVLRPDWRRAFHNAEHLLDANVPWRVIPYDPSALIEHKRLRFRLLANPTQRAPLSKAERLQRQAANENVKRPRRGITWSQDHDPRDAFRAWLCARVPRYGFKLLDDPVVSGIGYVYWNKTRDPAEWKRLRSALYEGLLEVTDADAFRQTLAAGIGPAKAFGFGLLSIAPAAPPDH